MNQAGHSQSSYPVRQDLSSLQYDAAYHSLEPYPPAHQYSHSLASPRTRLYHPPAVLYTQHPTEHIPIGTIPARDDTWPQLLAGRHPLVVGGANPIQPQCAYLPCAEEATRITQSGLTSGGYDGGEQQEAYRRPQCHPIFQEAYVPTRLAGFVGSDVVEFVVNGEAGIRLSDASDGNWVGLEGRDDRSLFEGERVQIIVRLHPVGCLPWQSKISTTDFTKKRRPVTRTKLAAEVAKVVRKFIAREKMSGHGCYWGDLLLENVFLTRLTRVSTASWRPEIFVELPSTVSQGETPSLSGSL